MEAEIAAVQMARMTRHQKLATLLVILGPDSAAQMLKTLDEHEVELVSMEMAKMTLITQEMRREILREFSEVAVQAGTATLGGAAYARAVLEKSVGLFRASDILGRVSPTPAPMGGMRQIVEMDLRQLFNLLKEEKPQTVALITSYLSPEKASQMLTLFTDATRDQIIERLATLGPTPIEVVETIVEVLGQKTNIKSTRALNQTGGLKTAAELLNAMDKNLSDPLLLELERRNPELGQAIRHKMFTFEDMITLDKTALQKVMREVDMRDLAVSLKAASPKLKDALLGCISKRAADTVNEEASFLGSIKKRDIEAAQLRIVDCVRRLESEGEIELRSAAGATKDEALV
ncbi:MAG TPA: flagellar motor switch protein FliG [Verrucomicrobiae bacterium]|jgi:flagellar motor switch protein FliG|nr:flagellar motor switch protein FliG [Verrucomicrobiae bacterium]